MADASILGVLCVGDIGERFGLEPTNTIRFKATWMAIHWRLLRLQLPELRKIDLRVVSLKSMRTPGVSKLAVYVMQTQQQRPECATCPFRIGISNNNEFLTLYALQLDPDAAETRYIRTSDQLVDEALQVHLAGTIEHGFRRFREVLLKAKNFLFAAVK